MVTKILFNKRSLIRWKVYFDRSRMYTKKDSKFKAQD